MYVNVIELDANSARFLYSGFLRFYDDCLFVKVWSATFTVHFETVDLRNKTFEMEVSMGGH